MPNGIHLPVVIPGNWYNTPSVVRRIPFTVFSLQDFRFLQIQQRLQYIVDHIEVVMPLILTFYVDKILVQIKQP